MRKIIFKNYQCPGDGITLLYAIEALHSTYPGQYITDVDCGYRELFEGQTTITPLDKNAPDVLVMDVGYELIHKSNQYPVSFIYGFLQDINKKLNINIQPIEWTGFLKLREEEKYWYSAVREILGKDVPYWIVDAGYKSDFPAKHWGTYNYQKVINMNPVVTFVQIGAKDSGHTHKKLQGKNVIDLIGQTDLRQFIRLVYNSFGVLTPCSFPAHAAYAVEVCPRFHRKSRACVEILGGREPNLWEQNPNQQLLHTCGQLDCCDLGGCWKSHVLKENDKDTSYCLYPVTLPNGLIIPKCLSMITPLEVTMHIKRYMDNLK